MTTPVLLALAMAASAAGIRQNFVSRVVALNPSAGVDLGMRGALTLPTPGNVAKQIALYEQVERELASSAELDDKVLLTIARSQLHYLRDRKGHLSDAAAGQLPYDLIQVRLAQITGEDDWLEILSWTEEAPLYLGVVRQNLRQGPPIYRGFVEKDGVAAAKDAADFFAGLAAKAPAHLRARFAVAADGARSAYERHSAFMKDEILPRATDSYGLGQAEYEWRLKNELGIKESASELQKKGQALADGITARMEVLAKQIDPSLTLQQLMAKLREDKPKDDAELLAAYRSASDRARDFVVAHKLFAIPPDYRIGLIETPAGMRAHIGSAAYFPAPPLDASRKGVFLVTPSSGDPKKLAIHNFSKIPTTVVHEAFPGHDMQFWTFQRSNIPTSRHLLGLAGSASALNVEGYAHYAEELMRERGFFTPKEELVQLASQLWRAYRIVLDAALNLGQMTMAEVAQTLTEKAFQPAPLAAAEAYRYARTPTQALTYLLGRLQIEELKREYKAAKGAAYDEAEFHRLFLSFGPVLPSLIRAEMVPPSA